MTASRYQYQAYPFHMVESSPWPILTGNAALSFIISAVLWFNGIEYSSILLTLGLLSVIFSFTLWFRDVTVEGTYLGDHTLIVQKELTMGVILFILTEVIVFLSIFWAYFHSSLAPTLELGSVWPPTSIETLNPFAVPLLNTILLLSSGCTVTYSHHALIYGNRRAAILGAILTLILATVFTILQGFEYSNAGFTIADGVYGSCFYFSTRSAWHACHCWNYFYCSCCLSYIRISSNS